MSQASLSLPVSGLLSGYDLVTKINAALAAQAGLQAGPVEPTTTSTGLSSLAGLLWHDTSTNQIRLRNQADNAWIMLGKVDESSGLFSAALKTDGSLQQTSAGLWRVSEAVTVLAGSQSFTAASHCSNILASAALTLTLPQASGLWNGCCFAVAAEGGIVTLQPNALDRVVQGNSSGTAGVALQIAQGGSAFVVCDGSSSWHLLFASGGNASTAPGGLVNRFRNAGMEIWQRGFSGSVAAGSSAYTADGWILGAIGAALPWARVPTGAISSAAYALQLTGAAGLTATTLRQRIESTLALPLAGQTVTLQVKITNGTGTAITPTLTVSRPAGAGGADDWSSQSVDLSAAALTSCPAGATTLVSYSFTPPLTARNGLEIALSFGAALNGAGRTLQISDPDIRVAGSLQAPDIRPQPQEWPLCQRYFTSTYGNGVAAGTATRAGIAGAGCDLNGGYVPGIVLNWPVMMRAAPAFQYWDGAGSPGKFSDYQNGAWSDGYGGSFATVTISPASGLFFPSAGGSWRTAFVHYQASAEL